MFLLKIANEYGNVDVRHGLPKGYVHVSGKRLTVLCDKLGIKHCRALIGFTDTRYGWKPNLDGVVVTDISEPKLRHAIEQREEKSDQRKEKIQERERKRKIEWDEYIKQFSPQDRKFIKSYKFKNLIGPVWERHKKPLNSEEIYLIRSLKDRIDWLVYADWLAEHELTKYELIIREHFREKDEKEQRRMEQESIVNERLIALEKEDITKKWKNYLARNNFNGPEAIALVKTLKNPDHAHHCWFRSAIEAVKRNEIDGVIPEFNYVRLIGWMGYYHRGNERDWD